MITQSSEYNSVISGCDRILDRMLFQQCSLSPALHADYNSSYSFFAEVQRIVAEDQSKTSCTPLKMVLWRPFSSVISCPFNYPSFMVLDWGAIGESGFIDLRPSRLSYFMPLSPSMMSGPSIGASRCVSFNSFAHGVLDQEVVDTARKISRVFRSSHQLALVIAGVGRIVFS
jgi:hypothetical protein